MHVRTVQCIYVTVIYVLSQDVYHSTYSDLASSSNHKLVEPSDEPSGSIAAAQSLNAIKDSARCYLHHHPLHFETLNFLEV
jgi:hypothetical protein